MQYRYIYISYSLKRESQEFKQQQLNLEMITIAHVNIYANANRRDKTQQLALIVIFNKLTKSSAKRYKMFEILTKYCIS